MLLLFFQGSAGPAPDLDIDNRDVAGAANRNASVTGQASKDVTASGRTDGNVAVTGRPPN